MPVTQFIQLSIPTIPVSFYWGFYIGAYWPIKSAQKNNFTFTTCKIIIGVFIHTVRTRISSHTALLFFYYWRRFGESQLPKNGLCTHNNEIIDGVCVHGLSRMMSNHSPVLFFHHRRRLPESHDFYSQPPFWWHCW